MNSYFFCVTQPLNAGDLLINRLLVEELAQYGNVFVDCCNCPEDFRKLLLGDDERFIDVYKRYGYSIKKGGFFSFFKLLKRERISLYTQSPGPLNKPSRLSVRLSYIIIRKALSLMNIPFVRIGCCCSAASARGINVIEGKVVNYYVRSRKGVEFLKQYRCDGIHYIPDLAFLYKYKVKHTPKKRIVAVSFREVKDNYNLFLQWLKNYIIFLKSEGFDVVFYYQVKSDEDFIQRIFSQLGLDNILLRKEIVWYNNFDFYSDKTIVISNRLHCLLMGAVYNAVPFAYIDSNNLVSKIPDVYESSLEEKSSDLLSDIFDNKKLVNIVDNLSEYQKLLETITFKNACLCRDTIENIVEIVERQNKVRI